MPLIFINKTIFIERLHVRDSVDERETPYIHSLEMKGRGRPCHTHGQNHPLSLCVSLSLNAQMFRGHISQNISFCK